MQLTFFSLIGCDFPEGQLAVLFLRCDRRVGRAFGCFFCFDFGVLFWVRTCECTISKKDMLIGIVLLYCFLMRRLRKVTDRSWTCHSPSKPYKSRRFFWAWTSCFTSEFRVRTGGWGERMRASTPPVTGKPFRFVCACGRAVSVMSFREEKVRRRCCIFYFFPGRSYLLSLGNMLPWGFWWLFPQTSFSRELPKIDSQERFPREFPKRDFQERTPRDISKRDSQEIFPRGFPRDIFVPKISESSPRYISKRVLHQRFPRDKSKSDF